MKKCPPGVICIENVSFAFVLIIFFVVVYLMYCLILKPYNNRPQNMTQQTSVVVREPQISTNSILNYPYSNASHDVLLNPYSPPLRDERYAVPINVSSAIGAIDTSYRQVGILTPVNKNTQDTILSLLGRPVFSNRDLWQYYTISNQHNNVKLPISVDGKSGSNEYGVRKLYNGDIIVVEGYNTSFRALIYENDVIRYLPI